MGIYTSLLRISPLGGTIYSKLWYFIDTGTHVIDTGTVNHMGTRVIDMRTMSMKWVPGSWICVCMAGFSEGLQPSSGEAHSTHRGKERSAGHSKSWSNNLLRCLFHKKQQAELNTRSCNISRAGVRRHARHLWSKEL